MRIILAVVLVSISVLAQTDHRTKELRDYLRENFGMPGFETSWYKAIKDARVEGDTAVAQVTGNAADVCFAISGFVYAPTQKHGLKNVRIVGSDEKVLIERTIAQPCR